MRTLKSQSSKSQSFGLQNFLFDVPENTELRNRLEGKSLQELTEILKRYKNLHNTTDIDTAKRAVRAIEIEEYYLEHPDEARTADRRKATDRKSVV